MESFDLNRFFKVLLNSKLYIAFILLLFLTIGYFYSFYYVTPMYKSSATVVLVQNDSLEAETSSDSITRKRYHFESEFAFYLHKNCQE